MIEDENKIDCIDSLVFGLNRTAEWRKKMAERILRAASDGITDPMTLTAIAVDDGMQPAD